MESCKNCDRVECPTLTMPPPLGADAIVVRATARNDCIAHTVNWRKEALRLRESQRWIPVGEKLPPLRNDHLSTVESRPVLVRSFDPKWPFSNDNRVQEATWIFDPESEDEDEEVGCWAAAPGQSRNGYNRLHWVTHWMPLPSPPEQTTPEVK